MAESTHRPADRYVCAMSRMDGRSAMRRRHLHRFEVAAKVPEHPQRLPRHGERLGGIIHLVRIALVSLLDESLQLIDADAFDRIEQVGHTVDRAGIIATCGVGHEFFLQNGMSSSGQTGSGKLSSIRSSLPSRRGGIVPSW